LSVGGDLLLEDIQVTYLPEGLSVGRYIYIDRDQDIEVPENLKDKIRYR
jgi:hypothetical protein